MPVLPTVRPNRIAEALREGRKALGFHLIFPMVQAIEMLGAEGFDFVYLDGEHGRFEMRDIEEACRAAELAGLTVVGRVPRLDEIGIRRYLDSGVQGIVVPHVSTAEAARAAVAATFHAPKGRRSFSSARISGYRADIADFARYYADANAQITLSVQVEDREGLANIDAIAAVEGIDYVTVGKQDLALDLGLPRVAGRFPPALTEAVAAIEAALARHGRPSRDAVMSIGRVKDFLLAGARSFAERAA